MPKKVLTLRPIANRKPELEIFTQILRGSRIQRILLIKASAGLGKTELLQEFKVESFLNDIRAISIDLKRTEQGIPFFLKSIYQELEQENFQQFTNCLSSILGGQINLESETILEILENALNVDTNLRKTRFERVKKAFFTDLKAISKPMVFLIDTFDQAESEMKGLIEEDFLKAAVGGHQLVIVVAGREVPDHNNIEWGECSHFSELQAIEKPEDWYDYIITVTENGLPRDFDLSAVRAAILMLKSMMMKPLNPLLVRTKLDTVLKRWQK